MANDEFTVNDYIALIAEENMEKGKQEGKQEGIQVLIKNLKKCNLNKEDILKAVMESYNMAEETSIKYLDEFY